MSTAQLTGARVEAPGEAAGALAPRSASAISLPLATAGALLALILYAAFEHGAVALPAYTRIEIAIAVIAAIAGGGWLLTGTLRLSASRAAISGLALFAGFACWSGITLVWSVAPNQTWIELNRAISYLLVLCLAIAVGASYARAITVVATGFLATALAVTVYALGQKLLPGLRIAGVISLDQTGPLPRLQEPLGYWNALALFIALGVPIALALAVDRARPRRNRLAAGCAIELMLLAIGLTYSRGGLIALAVGLSVAIWSGGGGLRVGLCRRGGPGHDPAAGLWADVARVDRGQRSAGRPGGRGRGLGRDPAGIAGRARRGRPPAAGGRPTDRDRSPPPADRPAAGAGGRERSDPRRSPAPLWPVPSTRCPTPGH